MLERYVSIAHHITSLEFQKLEDFRLTNTDLDDTKALCKTFRELESVTLALQNRSTSLAEARMLFDDVKDKHKSTPRRLGHGAKTVENPNFDSAIVKLRNRKEAMVTNAERLTLRKVQNKNQTTNQRNERNESCSFATHSVKRRLLEDVVQFSSEYINL